MASPRLETFCCPNRDAATEFVVSFQPLLFGALTLASAALSLLFSVLQLLPKRKGYRRLGGYPLPRPASSSRILFIISVCDMLGCAGKYVGVLLLRRQTLGPFYVFFFFSNFFPTAVTFLKIKKAFILRK